MDYCSFLSTHNTLDVQHTGPSNLDLSTATPGTFTPSTTENSTPECLLCRRPPTDRYLFRVLDAHSDGLTNSFVAQSRDAWKGNPAASTDLFSRTDIKNIAAKIYRHLADVPELDFEDNLVSWTTSLLYAIVYAFNRSVNHQSPLDVVFLCDADTAAFPEGVFVKDLHLYYAFSAYSHDLEKLH